MTWSSVPKVWKVTAALTAAFLLSFGVALALTMASNEAPTYTNVNSGISDGTFTAKSGGSCPGNSGHLTSQATFSNCVANNGACGSSTTRMMTFSEMAACRSNPPPYTQYALTLNGVAQGALTCDANCASLGGSAQSAQSYSVSSNNTVSISNGTYPISWSVTRGNDTGSDVGSCSFTITVGGVAVASGVAIGVGTTVTGGPYTGGATGTVTFTAQESQGQVWNINGNTNYCDITGTSVTYYH